MPTFSDYYGLRKQGNGAATATKKVEKQPYLVAATPFPATATKKMNFMKKICVQAALNQPLPIF
jgi:hypothetical protein